MARTDKRAGGDVRKLRITRPTLAADAAFIKASYDTWTEWKEDPIGYWLIRVDTEKKQIEAGFCRAGNIIEVVVTGKDAESIYNTIIRKGLVKSLQHAAYIGHELQKAEVALKLGIRYVQDLPLRLEGASIVWNDGSVARAAVPSKPAAGSSRRGKKTPGGKKRQKRKTGSPRARKR